MIGQIADVFIKWKKAESYHTLTKKTLKHVDLIRLSNEVDTLRQEYNKMKSMSFPGKWKKALIEKIRKRVDAIESELEKIAHPTAPKMPPLSMKSLEKKTAGMVLDRTAASFARSELQRIYFYKVHGELPPDPVSWATRRHRLVAQQRTLVKLRTYARQRLRVIQQRRDKAWGAQGKVQEAYHDPIITAAEKAMLEEDYNNWDQVGRESRQWQDQFSVIKQRANRGIEALEAAIQAGDLANATRH